MKKLALLTLSMMAATSAFASNENPLTFKIYNAPSDSFNVNSTLIYGEKEAVVIDAGFTKSDALKIAANVLDSGKTLTTIFISQADPDYYFGAETLKQLFPEVNVFATPKVRETIEKKMARKMTFWAPKMGDNAPTSPILPQAYSKSSFFIEGHKVEIKGTTGVLGHRPYLWIPSEKAIVGNVGIYNDMPVWMADSQTQEQLDAWSVQLSEMKELSPVLVIPGHMKANSKTDLSAINYTEEYLDAFKQAKSSSKNSKQLIDKMMVHYPSPTVSTTLSLGAKVHMGEVSW